MILIVVQIIMMQQQIQNNATPENTGQPNVTESTDNATKIIIMIQQQVKQQDINKQFIN